MPSSDADGTGIDVRFIHTTECTEIQFDANMLCTLKLIEEDFVVVVYSHPVSNLLLISTVKRTKWIHTIHISLIWDRKKNSLELGTMAK